LTMFKELLKRQLIDDVISLRFLIYSLLFLGALVSFALIFVGRQQTRMERFSQNIVDNRGRLEASSKRLVDLLGTRQTLLMRPRSSRFIADGHEGQMPRGLSLTPLEIRLPAEAKDPNTGSSGFPDIMFIVQFVFSFFALVLTFNAVSAEREKGTLRLVLSNSVERTKLLLAKCGAAFLAVGVPLLVGLIVSLVVLELGGISVFSGSLLTVVALFFVLSLLYLLFFILAGILFSTVGGGSKNSLVLCLLFWVLVVVVLPRATEPLLSLRSFDVPTASMIDEAAERALREVWDRHAGENIRTGDPREESTKLNVRISNEANGARQAVYDLSVRKKIRAVKTLMALSCVSPASLFEYSASAAAATGLTHFGRFRTQVEQYQNDLIAFFKTQDMKDKESPHLYFHPDYVSTKPFDAATVPAFEEREPRLLERIKEAAFYGAGLILYNALLLGLVFASFRKYDVR
jgi:ABC-type transport system involved in multi-copper enzyme maturation permease subunit